MRIRTVAVRLRAAQTAKWRHQGSPRPAGRDDMGCPLRSSVRYWRMAVPLGAAALSPVNRAASGSGRWYRQLSEGRSPSGYVRYDGHGHGHGHGYGQLRLPTGRSDTQRTRTPSVNERVVPGRGRGAAAAISEWRPTAPPSPQLTSPAAPPRNPNRKSYRKRLKTGPTKTDTGPERNFPEQRQPKPKKCQAPKPSRPEVLHQSVQAC
eukprot:874834-Prorocentrum_minimum.AAC.1